MVYNLTTIWRVRLIWNVLRNLWVSKIFLNRSKKFVKVHIFFFTWFNAIGGAEPLRKCSSYISSKRKLHVGVLLENSTTAFLKHIDRSLFSMAWSGRCIRFRSACSCISSGMILLQLLQMQSKIIIRNELVEQERSYSTISGVFDYLS